MAKTKFKDFAAHCVDPSYDSELIIDQYIELKDEFWKKAKGKSLGDGAVEHFSWFGLCDKVLAALQDDLDESCDFLKHMKNTMDLEHEFSGPFYLEHFKEIYQKLGQYDVVQKEIESFIEQSPNNGDYYLLLLENDMVMDIPKEVHKAHTKKAYKLWEKDRMDYFNPFMNEAFLDSLQMFGYQKELQKIYDQLDMDDQVEAEDSEMEQKYLYRKASPLFYMMKASINTLSEPFGVGVEILADRGYSQENVEQIYANLIMVSVMNRYLTSEQLVFDFELDLDDIVGEVSSIDMEIFPDDMIEELLKMDVPVYSLLDKVAHNVSYFMSHGDEDGAMDEIDDNIFEIFDLIEYFQDIAKTENFNDYYNYEMIMETDTRENLAVILLAYYDVEEYLGCMSFAEDIMDHFVFQEDDPLASTCRIYIAKCLYKLGQIEESYSYISKWQMEEPQSHYPTRALFEVYELDDLSKAIEFGKRIVDESTDINEHVLGTFIYLADFFQTNELYDYAKKAKTILKEHDIDFDETMGDILPQ